MRSIQWKFTMAMAVMLSFAYSGLKAQTGLEVKPADEAGIKKALASYDEAFNRHDPHGVSLVFAEDADFTNMREDSRHGRKDIETFFAGLYEVRLKNAHRSDTIKRIRQLAPGVAFVDADWEMTGTRTPEGKDNPPRKGMLMWVMSKRGGVWQITVFHESDL